MKHETETNGDRCVWLQSPAHLGRVRLLVPESEAPAVEAACERAGTPEDLLAELAPRVSGSTLADIAERIGEPADLSPPLAALARQAHAGEARILLTFGGQAQSYIEDLAALYTGDPAARAVVEACSVALQDELEQGANLFGLHPYGLNLIRWIEEPESRPDPTALAASPLSQPLILVAQAARLATLARYGLDPAAIGEWCVATTGHSQGLCAALLAAEGHPVEAIPARAAEFARYLVHQGIRMQAAYGRSPRAGEPMAAVTGLELEELQAHLAATPEANQAVVIAARIDVSFWIRRSRNT